MNTKESANGGAGATPGKSGKRGWVKTEQGWDHTDPRIQQMLFQIRAGRPFKEIAEQFRISVARVCRIRQRAGIARRIQPLVSN